MTFDKTRRPSSTIATDVSSQLVSIPRVRKLLSLGHQVPAQTPHISVDTLEVGFKGAAESRRVDGIRPHHDRVFAVVGVVTLAPSYHFQPEAPLHLHPLAIACPH